jgi:uncharacterized protein (DUF2384 family)
VAALDISPDAGTVAVKAFGRIADAWKLTREERRTLLAISDRTADRWRDPGKANPSRDQLERISYLLGIYAGLAAIFENAPLATEWVRRPNVDFGGTTPLARMLGGNVGDLADVRRYVDAWRAGW